MNHPTVQPITALVLISSSSPGYDDAVELVLPYLDHLGLPYALVDLAREPLPADVARHALIVIAHRRLDPNGARLGSEGQAALTGAVESGTGLVSFDPALPGSGELEGTARWALWPAEAGTVKFTSEGHYITSARPPGDELPLVGTLRVPPLPPEGVTLLEAGGSPLLTVSTVGHGRVVRWATCAWMRSTVLGPLAGLDGALWRSLVWAARKPFVLRSLAPIVAMRVDDVAGRGDLWDKSPLYWVRTANEHGFKPWLGLFLYNLTERAVNQLRDLVGRGQATAFPHAFGRPPRADPTLSYAEDALPLRADRDDEYIYFDHHHGRPWSDVEAARGLAAVEAWYSTHGPLPISRYAVAHWYEMGRNVMTHLYDRWGADLIGKVNDVDTPLRDETPWLRSGPFRRFEEPGTCAFSPAQRGDRPVYYADFANFNGRQFFNCVTEIRDDAGYEWAPSNDVTTTVGRGVRQIARALDSMALAVLFTHETDYLYKIHPETWDEVLRQIVAGIRHWNPILMTLDDAVRTVRATRTSRLASCQFDPNARTVIATFAGSADVPTHFRVFVEVDKEIGQVRMAVPAFEEQTAVTVRL